MRRFMVVPMAGLLALAAAAPVAAGPNVHNTSGGGSTIVGEWYDESSYGFVFLGQENGQPGWGEIFEESGQYVPCEGAGGDGDVTIEDTDESYGFQGTRMWGYAYDVQITLSGRFSTGAATGTMDLFIETVDECSGTFEGSQTTEAFSVALTGTGSVATFRGHGSYQIPSEFNGHYNYRGKERTATGSIDLGSLGSREFGWALMSSYTWTEHGNG